MGRRFDVYGVGNAIMDLQLRVTDEEIRKLGLEKAAMKLVEPDEQKKLIEYFHGRTTHQASGGSAANTMIAISQLGGKTAYGCAVGDDDLGRFYLDEMKSLGVELHLPPIPGKPTGTCVILISEDAERTMNTHLGASTELDAKHVSEECIAAAHWLYIEGYLFSSASGQRVVKQALALAKANKTKIALTFSDGFIVDVFGEPLREAVAQADLIFANMNEARRFTGKDDEGEVLAGLKDAAPNVALTLSERGAWVSLAGKDYRLKPFPVKAMDDTGAGDMFAGGLLFAITQNMQPQDGGQLACYLASKVVSQLGPRLQGDVKGLLARGEYLPTQV